MAPANPVLLLELHPLNVVQAVQIVDEPVGILGDPQHPLTLLLPDHRRAATLANALHHFLVGQDALAAGTPVHWHFGLVGQAMPEHLQKNPLGPLKVLGVRGIDLPVPIEAVAQGLQLSAEGGDVLLRHDPGMDVIFNGIVLRRQAERVIPNGKENVFPLHPLLPGNDVHGGVGPAVAHMEARPGGVGELKEGIELLLFAAVYGCVKVLLLPDFLPFWFNGLKVVRHILALFLVFLLIQHFAQGDDLPVAPKTLQVVKLPGFIGEHVNDHAAKIQQLPGVAPVALPAQHGLPQTLQGRFGAVTQGFYVGIGGSGADEKIISQRGHIPDADELNPHALLAVQGPGCSSGHFF